MKKRLALVDVDGMIYYAGAAGENRHYEAVFEDKEGNLSEGSFDTAAEIKEYLAAREGMEMIDRELIITPEPVEYSLRILKNKLEEIQSRYGTNMRVYIKGDGVNFRDTVYTVKVYKGNRQTVKPFHYDAMVEYLKKYWDAIPVDGKEVDDEVALQARQASKPTVVCSPDKDLDQIPGLHWNYTKSVEYSVDPLEAEMFFWQQVLSGDNADNIGGCWKVGDGKAEKIVAAWYEEGLTQEQIWEQVIVAYTASQGMPSCPYGDMDPSDVALQTARAVWMQTRSNVLWTPPGVEDEYMEIEEDDWA
jgi:hypothetical protein